MLPPPFALSTERRQKRSLIQDVTPFLNNIIFQYTNPLPFETDSHIIHTIPLARELCDSYIYYIRYKTVEITPSQNPFQVIFKPVKGISTGTYNRTIHPQNITLSIQDVFITYMQKLIEFNEKQDRPLYLPSHLDDLKHKSVYFEVPDLDTQIRKHNNPPFWLQQDIVQVKKRFFHNITLSEDTIPQIKIFTHFLLKFFRFNYQLLWEQQDQAAFGNFPQTLTETGLSIYIIKNEYRHPQYRDLTSFNVTYFEQINLDHIFITEHSETSDNRPYIITNVSPDTTPEEQTSSTLPQYIRQDTVQLEQDNITHLFQSQELPQVKALYPQLIQTPDEKPLNPSETTTTHPSETAITQNVSELSEETTPNVQNTQSFTITNDSNLIQVPTHNITHDETNNQNQGDILNIT